MKSLSQKKYTQDIKEQYNLNLHQYTDVNTMQGIFSKFSAVFDIGQKGYFLWKKDMFFRKVLPPKNFTSSLYSIRFLSALDQNKVLYNFHKRDHR